MSIIRKLTAIAFGLVLFGIIISVSASDDISEKYAADALYSLHLFLGYGDDADGVPNYGLDDDLTREQGILLLLRMLGRTGEAEAAGYSHPFIDVSEYYNCYIGYAYHNGLTNGIDINLFGSGQTIDREMFITFCLRALGWSDGEDGDFKWSEASEFAEMLGFYSAPEMRSVDHFTRGDAVTVFWNVLETNIKDSSETMAERLIAEGVIMADAYLTAYMNYMTKIGQIGEYELPKISLRSI